MAPKASQIANFLLVRLKAARAPKTLRDQNAVLNMCSEHHSRSSAVVSYLEIYIFPYVFLLRCIRNKLFFDIFFKMSVDHVLKVFEASTKLFDECKEGATPMTTYLDCFDEISSLLSCFGMIFKFVTHDIDSKVGIIREHCKQKGESHDTLESMLSWEVENNCTILKKGKSGSRTLLRLHRALEFFVVLMRKIVPLEQNAPTAKISAQAYAESLSHHHTWMVRQTVSLALKTMPIKHELVFKVTHCKECSYDVDAHIATICDNLFAVWQNVQKKYEEHQLLTLP